MRKRCPAPPVSIFLLFLSVSLLLFSPEAQAREAANDAVSAVTASPVSGGFLVYVGGAEEKGFEEALEGLAGLDRFLVHALHSEMAAVVSARRFLWEKDCLHRAAVAHWNGEDLPYADGIVNLLVLNRGVDLEKEEVDRVLAPLGACVRLDHRGSSAGGVSVKAWPETIDEWTHFLHDPTNNAVAHDLDTGPPFHVRWVGRPTWARHHNTLASVSALVSSRGRLFAIVDEGPTASLALPPEWTLVARDAFSGVVLWKREVGPWEGHLRPFRSGPPDLSRRLVAAQDRVFVTLGYGEPVVSLDAATGKLLTTYKNTEGTAEILHAEDLLYVLAGSLDEEAYARAQRHGHPSPPTREKRLLALRAEDGSCLWQRGDGETEQIYPTTLCCSNGNLFFQNPAGIHCLDAMSGQTVWFAERPGGLKRKGWSTPTLLVYGDVVLSAERGKDQEDEAVARKDGKIEWICSAKPQRERAEGTLVALDAGTGERLWSCDAAQGYNAPTDVFVSDGLVWVGDVSYLNAPTFTQGRDPRTGEVKRALDTSHAFDAAHHHRCYRNKATDQYIVLGRTGTEFIPLTGGRPFRNNWVRGTCQYGVLPCNGLLYTPPHSCACYIQSKLSGFWALAPEGNSTSVPPCSGADRRIQGETSMEKPSSLEDHVLDWPTYRGDMARSGYTPSNVANELSRQWSVSLGGRLSSPVVSNGVLCVARLDTHTVHALRSDNGEEIWRFAAGGLVDSPPTLYAGMAVFGCGDGSVYSLRLKDGALLWRTRVAPADRRIVREGQVSSVWPVTGSVLVHQDNIYCTAGLSSYLDRGMNFCWLDPWTGRILGEKRIYSRDPATGEQPEHRAEDVELPGAQPDVLACDGSNLFLRDMRLSPEGEELEPTVKHLYSPVGFLDDHWWHRTYWIYGTEVYGRASGWHVVGNHIPSGRLLIDNGDVLFGFGRKNIRSGDYRLSDSSLHLFRCSREVVPTGEKGSVKNNNAALTRRFTPSKVQYHWSTPLPVAARGMVLAGDTLFVAGPVMNSGEDAADPSFAPDAEARLLMVSARDGDTWADIPIASQPVFDGLVAAERALFLSNMQGTVEKWGADSPKSRDIPDVHFVLEKKGELIPRPEGMPEPGPYYTTLVKMDEVERFPYEFALYFSTDHARAEGGIWLYLCDGTPTEADNWVSYDQAVAAGKFDYLSEKPESNPIFVDRIQGRQTETPHANVIQGTVYMTYHNAGAGHSQSTLLATSKDGVRFTRIHGKEDSVILDYDPSREVGDGHTGYFRWRENPFPGVDFGYVGYSLHGGGDDFHGAMWGSNDAIHWKKLQLFDSLEGYAVEKDRIVRRRAMDPESIVDLGNGEYAAICSMGHRSSGGRARVLELYEIFLAGDGKTLTRESRKILGNGPTQALDAEELDGVTSVVIGDTWHLIYVGTRGESRENTIMGATGRFNRDAPESRELPQEELGRDLRGQ